VTIDRRVYHWPSALLTLVFAVLGVWMFLTVKERLGLTVQSPPDVRRSGTAQVESCSADALYMWLTSRCDARVQWNGEPDTNAVTVKSVHALSGRVGVVEREVERRGPNTWEVVAADYPVKVDGALFFVVMMAFLSLGVLGWFVGLRLAYLLPEPREKPRKLTLRSRMGSRRERFNGPRGR
jgi:hypothetical protein